METYELEEKVYQGLANDTVLTSILPNGAKSIYHLQSPTVDPARYPILVYAPISDVPELSADDVEVAHRVTIRIHVITLSVSSVSDYENFIECCKCVKRIMTDLKFSRVQSNYYLSEGKKMMILDFIRSDYYGNGGT